MGLVGLMRGRLLNLVKLVVLQGHELVHLDALNSDPLDQLSENSYSEGVFRILS